MVRVGIYWKYNNIDNIFLYTMDCGNNEEESILYNFQFDIMVR